MGLHDNTERAIHSPAVLLSFYRPYGFTKGRVIPAPTKPTYCKPHFLAISVCHMTGKSPALLILKEEALYWKSEIYFLKH